MTKFYIDRLTETNQCLLVSGKLLVYDVAYRHLNRTAKKTLTAYKWAKRSVVFKHEGKNKLLLYNN